MSAHKGALQVGLTAAFVLEAHVTPSFCVSSVGQSEKHFPM